MRVLSCLTYLVAIFAILFGLALVYVNTPGKNGLGYYTEAEEALPSSINLKGKNAIVTGGYSGIGIDTVRVLALRGAKVWIPARDLKKCGGVLPELKKLSGNSDIYCEEMDLANLASVHRFAEKWNSKNIPLHILINNGAIMACPYNETVDGYESQFATNHLGHFLLTNLLMDRLKQGKPSRVINVSSNGHGVSGIRFDDLSGKETWNTGWFGRWISYGQSKSANILFSIELNERMKGFGNSNSVHPGGIATNLQRNFNFVEHVIMKITEYFLKTSSQGSSTQLYVATSPDLDGVGGKYFNDCNEDTPSAHASDPVVAKKLWELSEKLTHLK